MKNLIDFIYRGNLFDRVLFWGNNLSSKRRDFIIKG